MIPKRAEDVVPADALTRARMRNPLRGVRFKLSADPGPMSVEDYRRLARRKVPDMVWAYIEGGAEDLRTLHQNRDAFARWWLRPRVLTGKEGKELGVKLGPVSLDLPVLLAPTGTTGLSHWTGELGAAQAAERAGTRAIISSAACYTPEEIAQGTTEDHYFQLYPWSNPATGARALTETMIRRAHDAGFAGLVVTVDVPVHGNREHEKRRGMGAPPTLTPARVLNAMRKPRWSYNFLRHQRIAPLLMVGNDPSADAVSSARRLLRLMRPELDWDDFAWMREIWPDRPLYIKGVLHPDDAAHAVELGADGVVVSNHGGRQLDGAMATLDALPAIVARLGPDVPVILDGGVRRGSDVVKALCLGATAVAIGRPYLYGLAAAGPPGVERVLATFREEIQRTLTLLGCESVHDLGPEYVVPAGVVS
jgi:L-lactate dehydrogenase (cytochrome)/(S)-mandelate dehydrogenase